MGYYVTYEGEISFPSNREDVIVDALKALNHRHELKGGGRHPKTGDLYDDYWFAWMPSRYHEDESLSTLQSILEMLGFEQTYSETDNGWTTITVTYDNKIGSEEIFLNEISRFGRIDIYASGEDGDKWRYLTVNGELLQYTGAVSYDDLRPSNVGKAIQQRAEYGLKSLGLALDSQPSI